MQPIHLHVPHFHKKCIFIIISGFYAFTPLGSYEISKPQFCFVLPVAGGSGWATTTEHVYIVIVTGRLSRLVVSFLLSFLHFSQDCSSSASRSSLSPHLASSLRRRRLLYTVHHIAFWGSMMSLAPLRNHHMRVQNLQPFLTPPNETFS